VPAETSVVEFEAAIRTVCEPIFQLPMKDISYGKLLLRLFQTARRFNMEVQPQLVLLQKTLLNIEGMGREVYPDLDLWVTAKPFLQRWMDEQVGFRSLISGAQKNLPKFIEQLPGMPVALNEVILQLHRQQQQQAQHASAQADNNRLELKRANQRIVLSIAGSALLLSAMVKDGLSMAGAESPTTPLMAGLGLILLCYAIFRR
jgi:ubiquinone biosynthesis protein